MTTSAGAGPSGSATSTTELLTLDRVVRNHLDSLASQIPSTLNTDPRGPWQEYSLPEDVGEYLVKSARAWAEITQTLVDSKQLHQADITFVKESYRVNRLVGVTGDSVPIDTQGTKLRKIKAMADQFAKEVQQVWESREPLVGNSPRPQ